MGIAISVPDVTGFDLLEYADIALYGAKDGGRAYAMVFDDELKEAARERALMELLLATAVEKGELLLHYQPEIDLLSGEILAVEALVRWQHPTRGLIGAGEFIANAEETGVVIGIDRWVFNEVCRQISIWRNSYPDLVMRVNMSPADFRNDDLVDFVKECLATHNLPAGSVCIEVTEHVLGASHRTASMLLELQEIGVDVAMDNFGTGFAAMTELKNLPVNFLKLDISFVKGVTTDNYDHAIIESIIRLAQVLKLGVIAEGIESPDLLRELILMGCTRGQGYLIARPGDVDETEALLARGSITVSGQRTLSSAPTSS
jgi:EAL domain-containing protein (putative c-di-GMP-specific phosphodiesterase class I)